MAKGKESCDTSSSQVPPYNPDQQALTDWALYGPKNSDIEYLIRILVLEKGQRLEEVERGIVAYLTSKIEACTDNS
ncbi:hypothetical protein [Kordiimonas sp.]|uniref:hypothetical protein n=1 Tax=Kordiimonas sp. TaxID=1970157 RepID=UPI003A9380F9